MLPGLLQPLPSIRLSGCALGLDRACDLSPFANDRFPVSTGLKDCLRPVRV